MIKWFFSVSFFVSLICSCTTGEKKYSKRLILEDSLPKDILAEYLREASLKHIESGVDSFEIRKWYPFYYSDSFPVILERYYYEHNHFKGEVYFFSTQKEGKPITARKDLAGLRVEKYAIKSIPKRFLDSLFLKFNLFAIDSIDLDMIREKNSNIYSIQTPRNVFFEQSTPQQYCGVFITQPSLYPGLQKSLDEYAAFSRFTYDSICLSDTGFKKWAEPIAKRIFGIQ